MEYMDLMIDVLIMQQDELTDAVISSEKVFFKESKPNTELKEIKSYYEKG